MLCGALLAVAAFPAPAAAQTVGPVDCKLDDPASLYEQGCTATPAPGLEIFCGSETDPWWYTLRGCRLTAAGSRVDCGQISVYGGFSGATFTGCILTRGAKTTVVACAEGSGTSAGWWCDVPGVYAGCFEARYGPAYCTVLIGRDGGRRLGCSFERDDLLGPYGLRRCLSQLRGSE